MKILEAQSGLLSNYEVYQHLVNQQRKNKSRRRRVPGNLATLRTEVLTYLGGRASPLAQQEEKRAYSEEAMARLIAKTEQEGFDLAKGELLMIMNIRPSSIAVLSTILENMEDRFEDAEQQARLVKIIAETLGHDELPANAQEDPNAMESIETGH